jgi:16S rRNA (uracil1498-N3)-methyltransferase
MLVPGPLAAGATIVLDAAASHHAVRVLRLGPADDLEVFDGQGHRFAATLLDGDARAARIVLNREVPGLAGGPLWIGLAQALTAGEKMDWVVEKAVELGAEAIQPLFSHKSVVRLDARRADSRHAHWQRIVVAACMQCGRDRLPELARPLELGQWLRAPRQAAHPGGGPAAGRAHALLLSPRAGQSLADLPAPTGPVWLLSGPEGGFTAHEEAQAVAAGWQALRLGPRVLRAETAGLAALAALQARFGDF